MMANEVADGVVLVVYVSVRDGRSVGRSSLWVEHGGRSKSDVTRARRYPTSRAGAIESTASRTATTRSTRSSPRPIS